MGASGWHYAVPYRDDIAIALDGLRQEVFARGEYYPAQSVFDWDQDFVAPDTIDELLEMQEEEGTHSILDMMGGVSDQPEFGTVSPLSDSELDAAFGTLTPTAEAVAAWADKGGYDSYRDRWVGLYVVSFKDGQADQLHFCGFSGD